MKYRYDQLQFSTLIPNFINIGNPTGAVICSGTYADGGSANFSTNITLNSFTSFADIYAINQNTGKKTLLSNNVAIDSVWQYISSETVTNTVTFIGSTLTVVINLVNNTGGPITITNQTFTILAVEYKLPI